MIITVRGSTRVEVIDGVLARHVYESTKPENMKSKREWNELGYKPCTNATHFTFNQHGMMYALYHESQVCEIGGKKAALRREKYIKGVK